MRQRPTSALGALLAGMLLCSGCGGSGGTVGSSAKSAFTKAPTIVVKSKALPATMPARYTCDGQDISPPLEWGAVPANTGSLALFVEELTPEPATDTYAVSIAWAIAGLNPGLHRLATGELPAGAYAGTNSAGKQDYSICPKKGTRVAYQFELYGLPRSATIARGFPALQVVRELQASPSISAYGTLTTSYERG